MNLTEVLFKSFVNGGKMEEKMCIKLKQIFGKNRVVACAGNRNTGKTNNVVHLIKQMMKNTEKPVPVYVYGMEDTVMSYLKSIGCKEISSLEQLVGKKNCLLVLDEFQKLKLNDRRHKDAKDQFMDFVYHNNVYVILSSANMREFNSVIGGSIEKWLLKSVKLSDCVNGCQLKKVVNDYKGRRKSLGSLDVPVDKLLLINDEEEIEIHCKYVREADNKKSNEKVW